MDCSKITDSSYGKEMPNHIVVFCLFVYQVIFLFGLEGLGMDLMVSVGVYCLPFRFDISQSRLFVC